MSCKTRLLATTLLAFLLLAEAAVAMPEWKGRKLARGRVRTEDGMPLPGAKVTLRLDGKEGEGPPAVETDPRGEWVYVGLARGEYVVTIEAEGYIPSEGPIEVDLLVTPSDVKLRRDDGVLSAAGFTGGTQPATEQADSRLEEGNRKLLEKDFAGARALYREVLAGPVSPQQKVSLEAAVAGTWLDEGNGPAARAAFAELLAQEQDPATRAGYLHRIARAYSLEGDDEEAVAALKRAHAEQPGNLEVTEELAELLLDAGRLEEARPYLAQLPDGRELAKDATKREAMAAFSAGKLEKAATDLAQLLTDYPEETGSWYYLGLSQLRLHRNAEAKQSFQKLLELAPGDPHVREAALFLEGLK